MVSIAGQSTAQGSLSVRGFCRRQFFATCTGSLAVIIQGLRIQVDSPAKVTTPRGWWRLYIGPFTHACSWTGSGSSSRLRWFTYSVRVCARFLHVDGPLGAFFDVPLFDRCPSLSSVNISKRPLLHSYTSLFINCKLCSDISRTGPVSYVARDFLPSRRLCRARHEARAGFFRSFRRRCR